MHISYMLLTHTSVCNHSYWPLTPSKTVSIWLALDDTDQENACMEFMAGSHRLGHLTWRPSNDSEGNVLDQTVDDPHQFGEHFYNVLAAGECSAHSDLLLHASARNDSSRRRMGLTLRYCTPDVQPAMGWDNKGVVVKGFDFTGRWAGGVGSRTTGKRWRKRCTVEL